MTFAEEIEAAAGGEAIEGVRVISDRDGNSGEWGPVREAYPTHLMTWSEGRPFLSYEYVSSYEGGRDCHAVYVWTPTRVFYVHDYDGLTSLQSLPRHPTSENIAP